MKYRFKNVFPETALIGAALTVFCGLLLWATPLGDPWVNASYDCLFRFGARAITNQVALVAMDNESYEQLHQRRGEIWDRGLHTELLNKLAADQSPLVVFDVFFKSPQAPAADAALADAMKRHGRVVLMADLHDSEHLDSRAPGLSSAGVWPPQETLLNAAAGCGVGYADPHTGGMARRHWPFFRPGEGDVHSLAWVAAALSGAPLNSAIDQQWLRYYGPNGAWQTIPYYLALSEPPGFFHDKIVFIGNSPEKSDPGFPEKDKFLTPYSRWNGKAVGGTQIMATTFLNLMNGDWLRRLPLWAETLMILVSGVALGAGLCRLRPLFSLLAAAAIFLALLLAAAISSYLTNYWFSWLVVAGGQLPCALAWSWVSQSRRIALFLEQFPGYTTVGEPFAEGAYGRVWVVRSATGQLQALKEIQRARFADPSPYEREFNGLKRYKPLSSEHPGLLHIDHVNANEAAGYFYYVMELGDPLNSNWQQTGQPFQPRDLVSVCGLMEGRRLPARECLRIAIILLDALDFLHQHGLVHRDIKPPNIIFVNGRPKLADVGLVRDVTPESTWVGTEFYMPPPPEPPGTKAADIYAMGKVLYVISTGKSVKSFSELSTTLVAQPEFLHLNEIICQACQPAADQRYASAAAMLAALRAAQNALDAGGTRII